jgi:hypothetical protein
MHVEQDDVRSSLEDDFDRGLHLIRFADDVERSGEFAANSRADEFVVVDEKNARLHLGRSRQN